MQSSSNTIVRAYRHAYTAILNNAELIREQRMMLECCADTKYWVCPLCGQPEVHGICGCVGGQA